jgi:heavy metal sensor kinase
MMLIVLILFGTFVYISMWQGLSTSIDDSIKFSTSQAIAAVNIENGKINFSDSLPESSTAELRDKGFTIRILSVDGKTLQSVGPYSTISINLQSIQDAKAGISNFSTIKFPDLDSIRIYTSPILENNKLIGIVQVMQSLGTLQETLDRLLLVILLITPVLLIVSAISSYFLAARALAPIDEIARTAQKISTEDLSARLNLHGSDDEIGRLANTFDSMLSRLEEGFNRERQFTADASHELRTPLAAMHAILSLVREGDRPVEEYRQALNDLSGEADRLRGLVEDLLRLARGDQPGIEQPERVDLSVLLCDVADSLRPLADAKGLSLVCDAVPGLIIMGDSDSLIRLLVNLLDNAIKFTDHGGVTVTGRCDPNTLFIEISDTGPGIAPEHLDRIFDRFYRVETARSTRGTGLGLAIARQIVQAHGGKIAVTSQMGEGTRFTVSLPAFRR